MQASLHYLQSQVRVETINGSALYGIVGEEKSDCWFGVGGKGGKAFDAGKDCVALTA